MKVISDSGPIIHLSWIDKLYLLQDLYGGAVIPPAVHQEILRAGAEVLGVSAILAAVTAGWIQLEPVGDLSTVAALIPDLDPGEAEAIVLYHEQRADLLLIDERRGRNTARARGLMFTGTLGLLQRARERGLIDAVYPLALRLRDEGFWLSEQLVDQIRSSET